MAPTKQPPPKPPFQVFLEDGLTGEEPQAVILDCLTRLSLGKETARERQKRHDLLWEELTYEEIDRNQLTRTLSTIVLEGVCVRLDTWMMRVARQERQWDKLQRQGLVIKRPPWRLPKGTPTQRPAAGNPLRPLVPWAKDLLRREAGITDPARQNDLLRLIGLPAQRSPEAPV
jgi:hypothetical protein